MFNLSVVRYCAGRLQGFRSLGIQTEKFEKSMLESRPRRLKTFRGRYLENSTRCLLHTVQAYFPCTKYLVATGISFINISTMTKSHSSRLGTRLSFATTVHHDVNLLCACVLIRTDNTCAKFGLRNVFLIQKLSQLRERVE